MEQERRFLLAVLPDRPWDRVVDIEDRYLVDSRLRLRRMTTQAGEVDHKLARKSPPHARGALVMGNLYLTASEHALLVGLPANVVTKRRHYLGDWGVDVFAGPLAGLVLAEIEGDTDALWALTPPFPVVREITDDPRYTGGHLATLAAPP